MNGEETWGDPGFRPDDVMPSILEYYRSGDERLVKIAKERIVTFYGRYVWKMILTDYPSFTDRYGDDLYHEGVIGLLEALETYDGKHAFTTCSKPFIKHELSAYVSMLTDNNTFYYAKIQKRVKEAISMLEQEGSEASVDRIAQLTGLSRRVVSNELNALERMNFVYMDGLESMDGLQPAEPQKPVDRIVEEKILREKLAEGIRRLDADKKVFLAQYFRRGSTQEKRKQSSYMRRKKFDEICDELKHAIS